jgi:hypothetical protein
MSHNLDNTTSIVLGGVIAGLSLAWTSFKYSTSFTKSTKDGDIDCGDEYILDRDNNQVEHLPKVTNDIHKHEQVQSVSNPEDIPDTTDIKDAKNTKVTNPLDTDLENNMEVNVFSNNQYPLYPMIDNRISNGENNNLVDDEKYYQFHLVLTIGSVYMAMLLTDWGTQPDTVDNVNITGGRTSMWVKITSQWITMLLYTWTLIVSKWFPGRNFT